MDVTTRSQKGKSKPVIHGICLVKNEGDIVEYTLSCAATWCDHIYVFDNGSVDDTWESVRRMAESVPQIVPFKSEAVPFDNALRGEVFRAFRDQARSGDWWCRLDADEVYVDNPAQFLASIPKRFHVVWSAHLQFYLRPEDVEESSADNPPPKIGSGNLPRHYRANAAEARFFRHRQGLQWQEGAWPRHMGLVYPKRIRVKHYQYRSPAQIQVRLNTRHQAIREGNLDFPHIVAHSWRDQLVRGNLSYDSGDGRYAIDEQDLPNHREPVHQRILKRIMHGTGIWP